MDYIVGFCVGVLGTLLLVRLVGDHNAEARHQTTISDWQNRIDRWVRCKLLPARPDSMVSLPGRLTETFIQKMYEELDEYTDAIRSGNPGQIRLEWADLFVTTVAAVHVHNNQAQYPRDYVWLYDGLSQKLPVLESGDWYYNAELRVFKRRKT